MRTELLHGGFTDWLFHYLVGWSPVGAGQTENKTFPVTGWSFGAYFIIILSDMKPFRWQDSARVFQGKYNPENSNKSFYQCT